MLFEALTLQQIVAVIRLSMAMQIETAYNERRNLINNYKISSNPNLHGDDRELVKRLREGSTVFISRPLADLLIYTCQTFRLDPNITAIVHASVFISA